MQDAGIRNQHGALSAALNHVDGRRSVIDLAGLGRHRPLRDRGSRSVAMVMRLVPDTQASVVVDAHGGASVVVMR